MSRIVVGVLMAPLLGGCALFGPAEVPAPAPVAAQPAPVDADIAAALRQMLALGAQRAVARLGATDGFWGRPTLRIPVPESMDRAAKALRALGQGKLVEEFHLSLNRAAESATPQAAPILADAIASMPLPDARRILRGPPTAATEHLRQAAYADLAVRFKPRVARATAAAGVTRRYKAIAEQIARYTPGFQAEDLDAYVTHHALDALFRTLAQEETRIRENPAARGNELLRQVFGTP
jgi:hypothetical protein